MVLVKSKTREKVIKLGVSTSKFLDNAKKRADTLNRKELINLRIYINQILKGPINST